MKIALVLVPKDAEMNVSFKNSKKTPRTFIVGRGLELFVLSLLLLCALALFIINLSPAFRFGATAVSTPKASGESFVCAVPARVIARPWDGSRLLQVGDLIVVRGESTPLLRKIAASPNETVRLRSGNSLKALYVVGDGSYLVVSSQKELSTVRSKEIRATLATAVGF